MGQSPPLCCVGKDQDIPGERVAEMRRNPPLENDIDGLRQGLTTLHQAVGSLQDEMNRLRQENGALQQANSTLTSENRQLLKLYEEQDSARTWNSFDIVEEHYRQLERHRTHIAQGELTMPEADEAAGMPYGMPSRFLLTPPKHHCVVTALSPCLTPSITPLVSRTPSFNDDCHVAVPEVIVLGARELGLSHGIPPTTWN